MASQNPSFDSFGRRNATGDCRSRLQFLSCCLLLLSGIFLTDGALGHPKAEDSEKQSLENGRTTTIHERREHNSLTNDKREALPIGEHLAREEIGNSSPQDDNNPSVEEVMESEIGGESTIDVNV